jgi:hypothetical protein
MAALLTGRTIEHCANSASIFSNSLIIFRLGSKRLIENHQSKKSGRPKAVPSLFPLLDPIRVSNLILFHQKANSN